jgi:sortase A
VIESARYSQEAAPLDKIFGFDLERDLNLITCDGVWNRTAQRYRERLVVYTRLATPPQ